MATTKDRYSEDHEIKIIDGNLTLHTTNSDSVDLPSTLQATSCTTGALIVAGGVGIGKTLWVCDGIYADSLAPATGDSIIIGGSDTETVTIETGAGGDGTIHLDAGEDGAVEITGTLDYEGELDIAGGLNVDGGSTICLKGEDGTKYACIFATNDLNARDDTTHGSIGHHAGGLVIRLTHFDVPMTEGVIEGGNDHPNHSIKRAGIIVDNRSWSDHHYEGELDGAVDTWEVEESFYDPKIRYSNPVSKIMFIGPAAFQSAPYEKYAGSGSTSSDGAAALVDGDIHNAARQGLGHCDARVWENEGVEQVGAGGEFEDGQIFAWELVSESGKETWHRLYCELPHSIPDNSTVYGVRWYFTLDAGCKIINESGASPGVPRRDWSKVSPSDGDTWIKPRLRRQQVDGGREDDGLGSFENGKLGVPSDEGNPGAGTVWGNHYDVMGFKASLNDDDPQRGSFTLTMGKVSDTEGAWMDHYNYREDDGHSTWGRSSEKSCQVMDIYRSEFIYTMNLDVKIKRYDSTTNNGTAIRFGGCKIYYITDNPCDPAGGNRDMDQKLLGTDRRYGAYNSDGTRRTGGS
tara:strand:+ start:123279 stop:125003 length:1725 start_codon:yes stop_codon:yes gene_type:complete